MAMVGQTWALHQVQAGNTNHPIDLRTCCKTLHLQRSAVRNSDKTFWLLKDDGFSKVTNKWSLSGNLDK
jgi:hypothetical protein